MTRWTRRLATVLVLATAVGCGEEAKPTGKAAPPPTEKQMSKESMKNGK